jgi:hypothetical protein
LKLTAHVQNAVVKKECVDAMIAGWLTDSSTDIRPGGAIPPGNVSNIEIAGLCKQTTGVYVITIENNGIYSGVHTLCPKGGIPEVVVSLSHGKGEKEDNQTGSQQT